MMAGNELCPQDYVDMIDGFVVRSRHVNKQQILQYCLQHTKELDPGDITKISDLVDAVVNLGLQQGALKKTTFGYHVQHPIEGGTVGPDVRPMKKLTRNTLTAIATIDKKSTLQMFGLDQPAQVLDDALLDNIPLEK